VIREILTIPEFANYLPISPYWSIDQCIHSRHNNPFSALIQAVNFVFHKFVSLPDAALPVVKPAACGTEELVA